MAQPATYLNQAAPHDRAHGQHLVFTSLFTTTVVRATGSSMMPIMSEALPAVSIVVPTYREADNLPTLIERVFAATTSAGLQAELIIVDDNSQDDTEKIVTESGKRHPVRLVVRRTERGLSSAVLRGFEEAKYDTFVVMDADLQHPPESIPELVKTLHGGDCDFVYGSRYVRGGRIVGDWTWFRRLNSWTATLFARPLAKLTDPMSGFFSLHRRTWERSARLDPIGYKIALELFIKGGCKKPAEVPITFGTRQAGESKLSMREQIKYLQHLARLYRFRYPVGAGLIAFVIVVAIGAIILGVFRWIRFGA